MGLIIRLVQFVGSVIQALLLFRFLLLLFGSGAGNRFGSFIFRATEWVVQFFSFIPVWRLGAIAIDFSILFAMLAVAIVWYLLVQLLLVVSRSRV